MLCLLEESEGNGWDIKCDASDAATRAGFLLLSKSGSITHSSPTLYSYPASFLLLHLKGFLFQNMREGTVNIEMAKVLDFSRQLPF